VKRAEPDESRRTSWTAAEAAVVYDRGRPGYPAAGVEYASEGLRGRAALRAADLGAGTGKLTQALVAAGLGTIAVEPATGMLKLLKHAVPHATVLAGSAEQLPLPDGSVDLVTAGQAFHWFDQDRALPEIARVLRPGGRLALFYNTRDDAVRWVKALADLVGDHADYASSNHRLEPYDLGPLFEFDGLRQFPYEQELDAAGLADLVGSRSYVLLMAPDERAALLERVRGLARTHPDLVGRQHFFMPYVSRVQRYRLRS
jgi:SAM-dependent methyltransferase